MKTVTAGLKGVTEFINKMNDAREAAEPISGKRMTTSVTKTGNVTEYVRGAVPDGTSGMHIYYSNLTSWYDVTLLEEERRVAVSIRPSVPCLSIICAWYPVLVFTEDVRQHHLSMSRLISLGLNNKTQCPINRCTPTSEVH